MNTTPTEPTVHAAANLFPLFTPDELAELAADIRDNGQREPIKLWKGAIVDGRNRLAACRLADKAPKFVNLDESIDPFAYAISLNLKRRHLTPSQRAMVAEKLVAAEREQAALRAKHQGGKLDAGEVGRASQKAGKLLDVSHTSVEQAQKVVAKGVPELAAAVEKGTLGVKTASDLADLPRDEQAAVVATADKRVIVAAAKKIAHEKREKGRAAKVDKIAEQAAKARPIGEAGKARSFAIVLADPPWKYDDGTTDPTRKVENHYPTMTLEEIGALKVGPNLCTDSAVLFLWCPNPLLVEGLATIEAWGFTFKSAIVWVKPAVGMGSWVRSQHEHLLIATRGDFPAPAPAHRPASVQEAPRRLHSAKPPFAHEIIEAAWPKLPKVELFQRGEARPGWSVWGAESTAKGAKAEAVHQHHVEAAKAPAGVAREAKRAAKQRAKPAPVKRPSTKPAPKLRPVPKAKAAKAKPPSKPAPKAKAVKPKPNAARAATKRKGRK